MQKSEFYYGLPQNQWDILLVEAEDLLRDNNLGSHLVGLYPAGNRIYGIESEPQGLLCLYIDSVESLINPSVSKQFGFHHFHIGHSNASIIMVNLFDWARWILCQKCEFNVLSYYFAHAIPFGYNVIYQDDGIADILESLRNFLIAKKFSVPFFDSTPVSTTMYELEILYKRTAFILSATGKFYPCINPEWDKVYNISNISIPIPQYTLDLDTQFRNHILCRDKRPSEQALIGLEAWYDRQTIGFQAKAEEANDLAKIAGDAVASLYRFQL